MMTDQAGTPAVRLRQAAKVLRKLALDAQADMDRSHPGADWHQALTNWLGGPVGDYSAALNPEVGRALAAWLDLMARIAEFAAERGYRTSTQTDAALAVADVILAGGGHHA